MGAAGSSVSWATVSCSGWARKSLIRRTPATADWMVWISMPRLSNGEKIWLM